jgi:site-specific DNA-methyltransferase (adenine-specific)
MFEVHNGDCLDVMAGMADNSVDAVVTDPPYGLTFLGKDWDRGVPGVPFWEQALRVAKPGAHLLAFGGTRTYHRLACAIEDAGWEVRDCLAWVYGSGFPKSHNGPWGGTALKPAYEPIILARKPLCGTVAANVAAWGCGGLNVDGCRVETGEVTGWGGGGSDGFGGYGGGAPRPASGRFPANLVHDGSDEVLAGFPVTGAAKASMRGLQHSGRHGGMADLGGNIADGTDYVRGHDDLGGSAARFFYCAKASRGEREAGLWWDFEQKARPTMGSGIGGQPDQTRQNNRNIHPTIKPIALMRWLVRLVTPPRGLVLDPFTGSGTTGCAAVLEGMAFVGAELSAEYAEIARARIAHHAAQGVLELEDS